MENTIQVPPFNWYLPNRKMLTPLHLPRAVQIPAGTLKALPFTFDNTGAKKNAEISKALERPFVAFALVGHSDQAAGYRAQISLQHGGAQMPLFLRRMQDTDAIGTAQLPTYFRATQLCDAGGLITVEVANLAAVAASIQIVLWGVEPE